MTGYPILWSLSYIWKEHARELSNYKNRQMWIYLSAEDVNANVNKCKQTTWLSFIWFMSNQHLVMVVAIGVGTSRGTLSWWAPWSTYKRREVCGWSGQPMDALHLKYPYVLFGSEGSTLILPLFLLSPRIIMLFHCSSTMTKDHFLLISYGTKWPMCVDVLLNTYSSILSNH